MAHPIATGGGALLSFAGLHKRVRDPLVFLDGGQGGESRGDGFGHGTGWADRSNDGLQQQREPIELF